MKAKLALAGSLSGLMCFAAACSSLAMAHPIDGPVQPVSPLPDFRIPMGEAFQLGKFSDAYPSPAELTQRSKGRAADDAFLETIMAGDGTLYWSRQRKRLGLGGLALDALTAMEVGGKFTTYYRLADSGPEGATLICQVRSRSGLDDGVGEATKWCINQLSIYALR